MKKNSIEQGLKKEKEALVDDVESKKKEIKELESKIAKLERDMNRTSILNTEPCSFKNERKSSKKVSNVFKSENSPQNACDQLFLKEIKRKEKGEPSAPSKELKNNHTKPIGNSSTSATDLFSTLVGPRHQSQNTQKLNSSQGRNKNNRVEGKSYTKQAYAASTYQVLGESGKKIKKSPKLTESYSKTYRKESKMSLKHSIFQETFSPNEFKKDSRIEKHVSSCLVTQIQGGSPTTDGYLYRTILNGPSDIKSKRKKVISTGGKNMNLVSPATAQHSTR